MKEGVGSVGNSTYSLIRCAGVKLTRVGYVPLCGIAGGHPRIEAVDRLDYRVLIQSINGSSHALNSVSIAFQNKLKSTHFGVLVVLVVECGVHKCYCLEISGQIQRETRSFAGVCAARP